MRKITFEQWKENYEAQKYGKTEQKKTAQEAWNDLQNARQAEEAAWQEHKAAEEKYGVVSDEEIEAWNKLTRATEARNKAQEEYNQARQEEWEANRK